MNSPAWEKSISRRSWLLAGLTAPLFSMRAADALNVRYDGDTIHVAPPSLHFLIDKPLERMRDGAVVGYVAQLDLLGDQRETIRQQRARFVISFALWEEKFSVTQLGRNSRTIDGLSAAAAEQWCFEALALSTLGLPPDRYFTLRFDIRTGGPKDLDEPGGGIGIRELIKLLGQRKTEELHFGGPFETRVRLADLPRVAGRGTRG